MALPDFALPKTQKASCPSFPERDGASTPLLDLRLLRTRRRGHAWHRHISQRLPAMQASHGCSVAGRAWHSVARPALTAPPASSQPPRRQRGASSSQNARRSDAGSWDPASSLLSALRDATRSRQDTISEQAGQAVQEGLKILGKFVVSSTRARKSFTVPSAKALSAALLGMRCTAFSLACTRPA